eukprot:gnl/TRDRNA2_/TRDRNA2_90759_c0_seq2.p1 gnl/TRDRNA2_/TRDRNA2_90759_c0~~gnl/TRDRNA2_/TRDRNA2_90759_c0_seq2.p1  ORF type:complete len:112 (+),score=22.81 gnl/TRDRNA2_/TRDRNA2_90759_c0_seq2:117-452(+)
MRRGFQWTLAILEQLLDGVEDLSTAAKAAYAIELDHLHGWLLQKVFHAIMVALPHRTTFYWSLVGDRGQSLQELESEAQKLMREFRAAARPVLQELVRIFRKLDLEDLTRV